MNIELTQNNTNRLEFLKQYTIENDRSYKLGEISKSEWLGERDKIIAELDLLERQLKRS